MHRRTARLRFACLSIQFAFAAAWFGLSPFAHAQDAASESIVVRGEELPSSYGAPPAFSRTRFAPTTTAYVLPPGSFLLATIWQGEFARHNEPNNHLFTQELEVGLPYRFGVAVELAIQDFEDTTQIRTSSIEARYALADWNKLPLNPTLFVEYKWGLGRILGEEGGEMDEGEEPAALKHRLSRLSAPRHHINAAEEDNGGDEDGDEEEEEAPKMPDAIEFRLLLAQDFHEKVEWALNGFFEQETSGDRGREWGFAQSIVLPITRNERLKAGVEMQYVNFTDKDTRDEPSHSFVIGPTLAWKPSRSTRLDVSPLFGVTEDAPSAQVFAVFSWLLGPGGEGTQAEAPASTRNR